MATYSFKQLESLWEQAGGPRKVAPIMAAIALAESGGRPRATHHNANGTTDRGLWQINSSHGYGSRSFVPALNAKEAVAIYHSQGLRAWSTYTSGAYKKFVRTPSGEPSGGFGIFTQGNFAGVDQGVDYRGAGPIPALAPVTITSVRRVSILEGGSWPLVGFRFDSGPYKGRFGYVMENFRPTVSPGQHLKAGQPIGIAAGQYPYIELGFASGPEGSPLAPLGSNPHAPTKAGNAMASYLQQVIGSGVVTPQPLGGPAGIAQAHPSTGGGGGVTGAISGAAGDVAGAVGSAASTVAAPFTSIAHTGESITSFLGHLVDPHFWLRGLEIVGGMVLVFLGLYLLARQMQLAPSPSQVAAVTPVGRGAELGEEAAAEMQFSAGRAAHRTRRRTRRLTPDESESAQRSRAIRERAARAQPSEEIPF